MRQVTETENKFKVHKMYRGLRRTPKNSSEGLKEGIEEGEGAPG